MTETPEEPTAPPVASQPAEHQPATATPPPPPATPPPATPPPAMPYPFMPVPRPPRAPWVNPAKRLQVGAAALALALVCGAAGIAIGWAASDGHGDRGFRMERPGLYGGYFVPGPGMGNPRTFPLPKRPALPSPSTSG